MVKTILIVEDNVLDMKLYNNLLEAYGYRTIHSVDGVGVVDLAREHCPALILMDIEMPEISGIELTKMLKADDGLKHIPVIAVTVYTMDGDEKKQMREAGCDSYITKPISIHCLLDEIRKFLTLGRFRLTDALKIGHPQIDGEHQQLVVLANEFMDFLEAGDAIGCAGKISELTKALKSHLINEERIMEEVGYHHFELHKKEHLAIISTYETLVKDAERNSYGGSFANKLVTLFADFIIGSDLGLKLYLEKINYQSSAPRASNDHQ